MNRQAFLATVRQAAQAGRRYGVHLDPVPAGAGYVGARGDLCEALAAEIQSVGGQPQVTVDWAAARQALRQLLQHYRPQSALCWEHTVLEQIQLTELLAESRISATRYFQWAAMTDEERRSAMFAAEVGISSVDFAVAETGSLVVCSRPGQERVVSLVPPVHIAVVAKDQIVPDLFDLFARWNAQGAETLPGNIAFISGPRKTGDIELELTTGVHGPGQWHVILVRQEVC